MNPQSAVAQSVHEVVAEPAELAEPRVLIIDDNHMIHEDIRKILTPDVVDDELSALEADLFGAPAAEVERLRFRIDSAMQGQEGLAMVQAAVAEGLPYALAFVDLRMPPGWDGVETIGHLWRVDPDLQVVICTAYSDYTWAETIEQLGRRDNLLILKKPFDVTEVEQLAHALTERWELVRRTRDNVERLSSIATEQGRSLEKVNAELATARAQVARVERLLRAAHERESVGRLATALSTQLDDALAEPVNVTVARAVAATLRDASELVVEGAVRADLNATVASAVTFACRQLNLTNVGTDFGGQPSLECGVGDLHHCLVGLVDDAARRARRVIVRTRQDAGWSEVAVVAFGAPLADHVLAVMLAREVIAKAGGELRLESDGDDSRVVLRFPAA